MTLGSITSPAAVAPGGTASATATVSSANGYAGTITLNCVLTGSPSGAVNLPGCSPSGTITLSSSATSGTATLSVTNTPVTVESSSLTPTSRKGLFGAGSGAVLSLLVFLKFPGATRPPGTCCQMGCRHSYSLSRRKNNSQWDRKLALRQFVDADRQRRALVLANHLHPVGCVFFQRQAEQLGARLCPRLVEELLERALTMLSET